MVERAPAQIKMTAAEFNAARAKAPGGKLNAIDTAALEKPISKAEPKNVGRNTSWPWLPPGYHGESPMLKIPVGLAWNGGSAFAKADEQMVQVQTAGLPEVVTTIGDFFVTTLFLTKTQARDLAAQLLNAAN
jgi:hypothetical protein